jgi:hypothetical protein
VNNPISNSSWQAIIRRTAINLDIVDPVHGPYHENTDVSTLSNNVNARLALKYGVDFIQKKPQSTSRQRAEVSIEGLKKNVELVKGPLREFQEEHGRVPLDRVGNWDETFLDLIRFSNGTSTFLVPDDDLSCNVMVPFERSPHFTLLICVLGPKILRIMVVIIGAEGIAPSPAHLQLLMDKKHIGLLQSENGWITTELKYHCVKQWIEDEGLGAKPWVVNFDGHGSNTELRLKEKIFEEVDSSDPEGQADDAAGGDPLAESRENKRERQHESLMTLLREHKCLAHSPLAHSTAVGTQQADLKDGVVERGCKAFDALMMKHVAYSNMPQRGKYKGRVSVAQTLFLVEQAFFGVVNNPAKNMRDHKAVGYCEGESGYLEWDPTLTVDHAKFDAARTFGSSGSQGQRNPKAQRTEDARQKMRAEMEAVGAAYVLETGPVCPPTLFAIPRGGRQSRNKNGCVVTEVAYEMMLRDEEQKKIEAANSKSSAEAKTAAAWEKQRSGIRAVEAQVVGISTPSKMPPLKVHELKSLIYGRTGHHSKASKKDRSP